MKKRQPERNRKPAKKKARTIYRRTVDPVPELPPATAPLAELPPEPLDGQIQTFPKGRF